MKFKKKSTDPTFNRMFRFPLRLTWDEEHRLNRFAGNNRKMWNLLLEYLNGFFDKKEVVPEYGEFSKYLTNIKKLSEYEYLNITPVQSYQVTARRLYTTCIEYFKYLKSVKNRIPARKCGKPRFHKRGINDSFTLPQGGLVGEKHSGFILDVGNNRIRIPNLGWVKCNFHRDPRKYKHWSNGIPKTVTFKKHRGRYYACISMEYLGTMPEKTKRPVSPIGIDCGIARSYQLSSGEYFNVPDTDDFDRKIRRLQRHKYKYCTKNSRQWKDVSRKIRSLYARKSDMVNDCLHKITSRLSHAHDLIALEALSIANMTKSARGTIENPGHNVKQKSGLNRSILQQNWGTFGRLLEYKVSEKGGWLVKVLPQYTSQTCPKCGYIAKENRRRQDRFICGKCGHTANADENAAINILMRGIKTLTTKIQEHLTAQGLGVENRGEGNGLDALVETGRKAGIPACGESCLSGW